VSYLECNQAIWPSTFVIGAILPFSLALIMLCSPLVRRELRPLWWALLPSVDRSRTTRAGSRQARAGNQ
jgi:hypothetical protein